jgi:hypothetical protein
MPEVAAWVIGSSIGLYGVIAYAPYLIIPLFGGIVRSTSSSSYPLCPRPGADLRRFLLATSLTVPCILLMAIVAAIFFLPFAPIPAAAFLGSSLMLLLIVAKQFPVASYVVGLWKGNHRGRIVMAAAALSYWDRQAATQVARSLGVGWYVAWYDLHTAESCEERRRLLDRLQSERSALDPNYQVGLDIREALYAVQCEGDPVKARRLLPPNLPKIAKPSAEMVEILILEAQGEAKTAAKRKRWLRGVIRGRESMYPHVAKWLAGADAGSS